MINNKVHNPRDDTRTSSQTSRAAATSGSSSGSIPPPGTIHLSGYLLLLTNNTCEETVYKCSVNISATEK